MTIERATIQDKNTLVALMREFDDYYREEGIFSEDFKPFWEYKNLEAILDETAQDWLSHESYLVFLAEEEGEYVGYICGEVRERIPRVLDKEGYINDWFVKKGWRENGIGMQLYTVLLKEFKKAQCNRLGLLTNVGNKKTIEFYHKLGFIDESVTMVKKLND